MICKRVLVKYTIDLESNPWKLYQICRNLLRSSLVMSFVWRAEGRVLLTERKIRDIIPEYHRTWYRTLAWVMVLLWTNLLGIYVNMAWLPPTDGSPGSTIMDEITGQVGECERTLVCQTGDQGTARKKDVLQGRCGKMPVYPRHTFTARCPVSSFPLWLVTAGIIVVDGYNYMKGKLSLSLGATDYISPKLLPSISKGCVYQY